MFIWSRNGDGVNSDRGLDSTTVVVVVVGDVVDAGDAAAAADDDDDDDDDVCSCCCSIGAFNATDSVVEFEATAAGLGCIISQCCLYICKKHSCPQKTVG